MCGCISLFEALQINFFCFLLGLLKVSHYSWGEEGAIIRAYIQGNVIFCEVMVMNIKIQKRMMVVFLPLFLLVGCGSDDNDDVSSVTDAQAKSAATEGITRSINANLGGAGELANNSTAIQTAINGGRVGTQSRSISFRAMNNDDLLLTNEIENKIDSILNELLSNGVRDGDTITYDPDENALCADEWGSDLSELIDGDNMGGTIAECVDMFSHITLMLTIISDNEGTLAIKYDGFSMMVIGYAPNSAYFETDLAQLKLIYEAVADEGNSNDMVSPATFEGVTRLTFTALGTNYGRVTLSIEDAINVVDQTENKEINVHLGATPKVFEVTINGSNETASIEVGLAAVQALFPLGDNDDGGIIQQAKFDLKGLTLKAELETGGDKMVFTNVGIGRGPFTFNVLDPSALTEGDDQLDLSLALSTFGFTINGLTETIFFDSPFSMALDVNDVFGVFADLATTNSSLNVDIVENTEIKPLDDVMKVNSGSVSVEGTGDFTGSAVYTAAQCFTSGGEGDFALVDAACP